MIGFSKSKTRPRSSPCGAASAKEHVQRQPRLLLAKECAKAGPNRQGGKDLSAMAESAPSEQIYKDLFLLYKDHIPHRRLGKSEMINDAFELAIARTIRSPTIPAPAQAKAMVAALRANDNLAKRCWPLPPR